MVRRRMMGMMGALVLVALMGVSVEASRGKTKPTCECCGSGCACSLCLCESKVKPESKGCECCGTASCCPQTKVAKPSCEHCDTVRL